MGPLFIPGFREGLVMMNEAIERPTSELSYEEKMDQLLVKLNSAASKNRKKSRVHILAAIGIMIVMGAAIYFGMNEVSGTGEFMGFITNR